MKTILHLKWWNMAMKNVICGYMNELSIAYDKSYYVSKGIKKSDYNVELVQHTH